MYKTISPPDAVVGMTELDRDKFRAVFTVPSTIVAGDDVTTFNERIGKFKSFFLKLPNFKPVQEIDNGARKIIIDPEKLNDVVVGGDDADFQPTEIELGYENFYADAVLKKVLSQVEGDAGGAGFSIIGHILHLNLRNHLEPYKKVIGQVLLDKTKNVQLVVNKTTEINSTYRNFSFEVLAGDASTVARVRENGCVFEFDFAQVYWNPRLSTEHDRIVKLLPKGCVLFDVFGGVGPFAVPAAKKGCTVYANDLNPNSYEYLVRNIQLNKVQQRVEAFNMDGREFLTKVLPEKLPQASSASKNGGAGQQKKPGISREIHVVMNLPAMAVEFLDVFRTLTTLGQNPRRDDSTDKDCETTIKYFSIVLHVHCYCFVKAGDGRVASTWALVRQHLGDGGGGRVFAMEERQVQFVRSVAPGKDMMRASFVLKFGEHNEQGSNEKSRGAAKEKTKNDDAIVVGEEPDAKKLKTDELE